MLTHYFKSAWRNLLRSKRFSFINIAGLTVGITCAALIFLWIENEYDYNKMFSSKDNIFLIENNHSYNKKTVTYKTTSPLLAPALVQEIPQIKSAARCLESPNVLISLDDKKIFQNGSYVDPSFTDVFDLKFIFGNKSTAFGNTNDIIITQSLSKALFGNDNPIGKIIKLAIAQTVRVSAVIKDFPKNSTFNSTWLANYKLTEQNADSATWTDNYLQTYVKLNDNVNLNALNQSLKNFITNKDKQANASPMLYSIRKLHLYNSFTDGEAANKGNIGYVKLFAVIAFIILLIACINFMNLATARAQNRIKEVSVRKVMGANRKILTKQFLTESFLYATIATVAACVLVVLLLPYFNALTNADVRLHLSNPLHVAAIAVIIVVCTFLAGGYPAFYLSAFSPVKVMKQSLKSAFNAVFIRKGLVIIQFSISVVLMIATIIIYKQIQFSKNRDLGFNKNNIIYTANTNYFGKIDFIKNKLMNSGVVQNVSLGYNTPIGSYDSGSGFGWNGKDNVQKINISNTAITPDYFSTFGIQMLAGRDFQKSGIDSNNVIINETLAKMMRDEGRVGKQVVNFGGAKATVIGIVKDFVFDNMNALQSKPLVYSFDKENYGQIFIALKPNVDLNKAINTVKKVYETAYPKGLFDYKFLDEDFEQSFHLENLVSRLSAIFGALAIFLSCMGLFGLSAFTAEQRTKEIGIRKVLGASVKSVVTLLSKDFLKLVSVSCIIAFPIAYWSMSKWLMNYEYRINIGWSAFALAAITALLIAFITVSSQAVKAARANPVKSLKTE